MSYDVSLKCPLCGSYIFESQHTSNTCGMWEKHGFDFETWGDQKAGQMLGAINVVLNLMVNNGKTYYAFALPEGDHGWGTYESTIKWFLSIREACSANVKAIIEVDL